MTQPHTTKELNWVHFPFAPCQCPFFYGWVIVLATTLGTIASIPGQTMGVGVFADKLMGALGLTRTQLSSAYMLGTIASSLLLPWAGSLTDRLGTRVMVVVSSVGLGLSLLIMSFTAVIPTLVNTSLLCMGLMAGGFFLIRFFGQGCLTLVSRARSVMRCFPSSASSAWALLSSPAGSATISA